MVGGLVQQQQVGAAHQRLREVEPHPPAAGKIRHRVAVAGDRKAEPGEQCRGARARGIAADVVEAVVKVGERLAGEFGIDGCRRLRHLQRALDGAELMVAVQHELDGRRIGGRRLLRDVGDRPRRRQRDVAGVRVKLAQEQREQTRFAAAVRPDQPDLVPGMDREVRAFEQAFRPAGQRQIGNSYQGRAPVQ